MIHSSRAEEPVDPVLPFIETAQFRRFEKACDRAFEDRSLGLVISESGKGGKSENATQVALRHQWPISLPEALVNLDPNRPFDLSRVTQIFGRAGLFNPAPDDVSHWLEKKFIATDMARRGLADYYFCAHDRLDSIQADRATVAGWAEEPPITKKVKTAERVGLFLELGVMDARVPYHVILRRGSVMDRPHILLGDLSRELCGPRRPYGVADRRYMVTDACSRLRLLLIVDEANLLDPSCFDFYRELHDLCKLPIVFVGTSSLLQRLSRSSRLDSIGTRVSFTLELKSPTLSELKAALPNVPEPVLVRAWARSGHNLRLFRFILTEMRRAVATRPGLRPTPTLVDDIAALLPCARPATEVDPEELPGSAQDDAAPAITSTVQAGRLRAASGR